MTTEAQINFQSCLNNLNHHFKKNSILINPINSIKTSEEYFILSRQLTGKIKEIRNYSPLLPVFLDVVWWFLKAAPIPKCDISTRLDIAAKKNAMQRFSLLSETNRPFYYSDFISSFTYLLRFLERDFGYQWNYVAMFSKLLEDRFPADVPWQFINATNSRESTLAAAKQDRELNESKGNNRSVYQESRPVHAYNSSTPLFAPKRDLPMEENPGNKKMKIEFLCN